MNFDENTRKLIKEAVAHADPALVAKFGNPLDDNDPRNWTAQERAEKGVSLEDQILMLSLDLEAQTLGMMTVIQKVASLDEQLDRLQKWAAEQMANQFMERVKTDPEGAAKQLAAIIGEEMPNATVRGAWNPTDDPNAEMRYAGSTQGIAPDMMVQTPQGTIRADQIPGYRNDPSWKPSPDWVDANCMCPTHVAQREGNKNHSPGDDFPTGFYL